MSLLARFLATWIAGVHKHAVWVTIGFFVVTFFLANFTTKNLGINTSTADMVAEHLSWRQDFIDYRQAFPDSQNNLVIVLDGTNREILTMAIRDMGQELEQTGLFESAYSPTSNEFFDVHGLLFLNTEELERLGDSIARYQPILASLARNQTVTGLFELLSQAVERGTDLATLAQPLTEVLEAANNNRPHVLSWSSLLESGADSRNRGFLILKPRLDFARLQPAKQAIQAVRNSAVLERPGVTVRITGSVALEYEELQSVTRGVKLAGVLAILLVALFLYLALRSWVLIIASLLTLTVGLIATAAFAAATFSSLNLISVAFAVLYIGLGSTLR